MVGHNCNPVWFIQQVPGLFGLHDPPSQKQNGKKKAVVKNIIKYLEVLVSKVMILLIYFCLYILYLGFI